MKKLLSLQTWAVELEYKRQHFTLKMLLQCPTRAALHTPPGPFLSLSQGIRDRKSVSEAKPRQKHAGISPPSKYKTPSSQACRETHCKMSEGASPSAASLISKCQCLGLLCPLETESSERGVGNEDVSRNRVQVSSQAQGSFLAAVVLW